MENQCEQKIKGHLIKGVQTGCPKHENKIPPMAAETMTTTRSEINLQQKLYDIY